MNVYFEARLTFTTSTCEHETSDIVYLGAPSDTDIAVGTLKF